MASDEWVPAFYVYNNARRHIMGIRTADMKVATYTNWNKAGVAIKAEGANLPSSFTLLPQRCEGFKPAINFAKL